MSSSWRTSIELVEGIVEVDTSIVGDNGTGLGPFIDAANDLVTNEIATPDATTVRPYELSTLTQIETWLSAHFYGIRDPQASSEGAGGASQSYWGSVGMLFEQTRYGQMAMALDRKGYLAALQKRLTDGVPQPPGVIWLGTRRRRGRGC